MVNVRESKFRVLADAEVDAGADDVGDSAAVAGPDDDEGADEAVPGGENGMRGTAENMVDSDGKGTLEAVGREVVIDAGVQDAPAPSMQITIRDNNSFFTFSRSFSFYL